LLWQWIFDHRGSDNAAYSTTDVVAYGDAYKADLVAYSVAHTTDVVAYGDAYKTDLLAYSVAHKTDSTAYGVAYYSAYNHALVYHVCLLVRNK